MKARTVGNRYQPMKAGLNPYTKTKYAIKPLSGNCAGSQNRMRYAEGKSRSHHQIIAVATLWSDKSKRLHDQASVNACIIP